MYLKEMTRLNAALNALYMEQDDIYSAYAAHFGLSGTAFWILYAICESDEVKTQNALADGFHMPRQSINSAAAALAKQGYVALGADAERYVELTHRMIAALGDGVTDAIK